MKIVIQRSKNSQVQVNNETVGAIDLGMVLLVCLEKNDTEEIVKKAAQKISALRIFTNKESGKMSENINYVNGSFLCISQFTLCWDGQGGNRPGFENSMPPALAENYFNKFCELLKETAGVEKGVFGESMQVSIVNDGPVTFSLQF